MNHRTIESNHAHCSICHVFLTIFQVREGARWLEREHGDTLKPLGDTLRTSFLTLWAMVQPLKFNLKVTFDTPDKRTFAGALGSFVANIQGIPISEISSLLTFLIVVLMYRNLLYSYICTFYLPSHQ